ncbi:DSD1 family PLP-dependent enzyme [Pseudomonas putida]|uniref:DSD1 family PLP-dependent enzyme n=1 Tax=Pseudomonas putida TaxID=303 RepID=UPI002363CC74|nr:DSD1 family PLP-dependent enzyme [Pseudomonas putida]MDD2018045.1 DSD1 family PLP-dependent enzyme [Pseudomonas putida]HDS1774995.1 DSD1 family PLP-dependent enzyme [Pseudomonas putida]
MKSIPEHLRAAIGLRVDLIDTPAPVVDLDAMERNIQRMTEFAHKHQVRWRPHAKMHKSAEIALQLEKAGARGHCVQKVSEAEALAAGGVVNLYISNEVLGANKLLRAARLAAQLAARGGRLAIAVDSEEGIARLAEAMRVAGSNAGIGVFVEIDVGQARCGVPPGPAALALAQAVVAQPRLQFAGLQAYHGGAQHLRSAAERREAIARAVKAAADTRTLIEAAGLPVPLITGSGTGTLVHEAASGVYGELQAGSFLFMDADYACNERENAQPLFEQALFVKTQVISVREDSHVVCDAGHKSHAIDSGLPLVWGLPPERALRYANGGDEHGILYRAGPQSRLPALGQMLWLVPGHCDPTVNLHNHLIGVRGGLLNGVVERIIRVDARGALT